MINLKQFTSVGIVGFGGYVPFWRLGMEEVGSHWGADVNRVKKSLGIEHKAVASHDEDALTMAVEASTIALQRSGISPKKIGAIFIGSESHPYAVKPTGTILGDILGIGNNYFCADLQFACKAGTAGIQIVAGMIEAGMIDYGLVVGVDKAQAKPADALEYTASAGAAAFILGNKKERWGAQLMHTFSHASDTPDFWRRSGEAFPSHGGRFTGTPGYFGHIEHCLETFLEQTNKTPADFDYVIFHMPNTKFPLKVAKKYGFTKEQLQPGFLVPHIGNPYAASSPLGLISVLEQATRDQNILVVSYGSGAGSDAFWFKTEKPLKTITNNGKKIADYINSFEKINYLDYLTKQETI